MTRLSVFNPWKMISRMPEFDGEDWDLVEMDENQLDMYEEKDNVVVKVKAPGFREENFDITVEDGNVCITGNTEEKEEEENKKRKYYRKEIKSRSFTRRVSLPVRVQANKAEAEYENGVLTLHLPKAEEAKPKTITIKAKKK